VIGIAHSSAKSNTHEYNYQKLSIRNLCVDFFDQIKKGLEDEKPWIILFNIAFGIKFISQGLKKPRFY
jgi:predicted secreted protein